MRFLFVGAGALGGYFGGRLLQAGRDVSFLLRPRRAAQLAKTGLVIKSPLGDATLAAPRHVLADTIDGHYDVVVVGCKAYDLADTMESFAKAVGPGTAIVPLLNGMSHLEKLDARFGRERVLGGLCMISAALDAEGHVQHFNDMHRLVYGERDGSRSARVDAIAAAFEGANFESVASQQIEQEMWEKWTFIAAAAGMTSLMRGSIGDIVAAGATDVVHALVDECAAIAAHNGHALRPGALERARANLTVAGSPITASMFKDIERGGAIEGDQIVGDLLALAPPRAPGSPSVLRIVAAHLKTYEARRAREGRDS
jgi:2-dehydropantoate 2-reductase